MSSSCSNILVVDDDEDSRVIVAFSLRGDGHVVTVAQGGDEALSICRAGLPDAIVTDLMMPGMNGVELVRRLRTEFSGHYVPILMLTAHNEAEQKMLALEAGADDFLSKPFHYRELRARLHSLLRTKDLTRALELHTAQLEAANAELSRMQQELVEKERLIAAAQMAGAAAHNLGQPITAILLNCAILERCLEGGAPGGVHAAAAVTAIKRECAAIRTILEQLQAADARKTEEYIGDLRIIGINKQ